jgi:hypothetical protein
VDQVAWSDSLAAAAQRWADRGEFKHATGSEAAYNLSPPEGPAGENLAKGHNSVEDVVDTWYNEVANCGSLPGCKTGSKGVTGHFTPIVWKGVKEIGCAIGPQKIYVCRYKGSDKLDCTTPNMAGCFAQQVLPWTCKGK